MEIRCRIPKGVGLWPAFWTWHHQEIDVFEYFSTEEDDHFQTNYHSNGKMCPQNIIGNDLTSDFHVYSVEITPWWIKWFLDGQLERTVSKYYTIDGIAATTYCGQDLPAAAYKLNSIFPNIQERWFAPIVNLAINPKYSIGEISGLPANMEIDYVRIYKKLPEEHEDNLCKLQLTSPDYVCVEQTFDIQINSALPLNELQISSSANIEITGINNSIITARAISAGTGWIHIQQIGSNDYCNVFSVNHLIQVSDDNPTFIHEIDPCEGICYAAVTYPTGLQSYSWSVVSNFSGSSTETNTQIGYGKYIDFCDILNPYNGGNIQITLEVDIPGCGIRSLTNEITYYGCDGPPAEWRPLVNPNPAQEYAIVSIVNGTSYFQIPQSGLITQIFSLTNTMNVFNTVIYNNETLIHLDNLPNDVYAIRVFGENLSPIHSIFTVQK